MSLTIDNTAGLLPIEFTEVTITRTLFRTGESEYQINGVPCRLLDIQELLSDTGIGRQQHVIVGQGQLDTVLNSSPADRRAIVEEAAGILKYRKRKERAERRLAATEGNLLRLNDLLREVRRQLAPLQRQADAAQRHGAVVDELRAIKLHLAGHQIAGLQTRIERLRDERAELDTREGEVRDRLRDARRRGRGRRALARRRSATTTSPNGSCAPSRCASARRGLAALIDEKRRGVERELAAAADEGVVETLVADAVALRGEIAELDAEAAEPHAARHRCRARGRRRRGRAARRRGAVARLAESEAARWRARADALDAAAPHRGARPRAQLELEGRRPASSARSSTTSRSTRAPRWRWRPRSVTRCAPSSSSVATRCAQRDRAARGRRRATRLLLVTDRVRPDAGDSPRSVRPAPAR